MKSDNIQISLCKCLERPCSFAPSIVVQDGDASCCRAPVEKFQAWCAYLSSIRYRNRSMKRRRPHCPSFQSVRSQHFGLPVIEVEGRPVWGVKLSQRSFAHELHRRDSKIYIVGRQHGRADDPIALGRGSLLLGLGCDVWRG